MKAWFGRFNIYFLAVVMGVGCGCHTTKHRDKAKKDKDASTVRLYLEVNPDGSDRNMPVTIFRASPVSITINKTPFLTEGDLEQAKLVDTVGIPSIQLKFKWPDGMRMLEMVTTSYKGQRIAVFSQFGPGMERWLAAPQITKQVTDGVFSFTPDASRAEAERIVKGLTNVVQELKKSS